MGHSVVMCQSLTSKHGCHRATYPLLQELGLEIINSDDLKVTVQVVARVPSGEVAAHECHCGINVIRRHRHKASHRRSTTGNPPLDSF